MKALLVQANPTVGALEANARRIEQGIDEAAARGADLVLFPELALTGYPPRDLVLGPAFVADNLALARAIAGRTGEVTAVFGFVDRDQASNLYNAAAVASRGALTAVARKLLLPNYDVFDEARYFRPGAEPLLVTVAGRRCGLTICEDVWNDAAFWGRAAYDREPVSELVGRGMEVLLTISASPFSTGRTGLRPRMMASFARRHRLPAVYLNQVGGNDELVFDGSSFALDAEGAVIAACPSFAEHSLLVDLDGRGGPAAQPAGDTELALAALALGLRDYVSKCGFSRVVLGLSGGIDSALVACIARQALGAAAVTAVFMPSRFTSASSGEDARALARVLGIRLVELPIDAILDAYLEELEGEFRGTSFGTAEENIQARIRGNVLMALSNKHGFLVLSTGNKSELAVGYCTLYGDMSGGLAVIADLPKTMVYEVARRASRALGDAIPERVFTRAPSAELRPDQTDQDTLPPYPVLDAVLAAYIEDGLAAPDIAALGHDPALVRRILSLVDRNEYKRGQAAPGLRVTSKAFGMGRRMPIAQGYSPRPDAGNHPAPR